MGIESFPAATQFIDENGSSYGIKHIGNKPQVVTTPIGLEIAAGNVGTLEAFIIPGYNPDLTASPDLTSLAGVIPIPSSAAQMWVDSTSFDGYDQSAYIGETLTGGSATTIEDAGQTFQSDAIMDVGEQILLPDDFAVGTITELTSETVITCSAGFISVIDGSSVTPGSGDRYWTGKNPSGVLVIEIEGLDSNYVKQTEQILLSQQVSQQTVNSYLRLLRIRATAVFPGVTGAAGNIHIQNVEADGSETIYIDVAVGEVSSVQAFYTVPAGKVAFISSWAISAHTQHTTPKPIRAKLQATVDPTTRELIPFFHTQDEIVRFQEGGGRIFEVPLKCPAQTDIKITVEEIGVISNGIAGGNFILWLEDA